MHVRFSCFLPFFFSVLTWPLWLPLCLCALVAESDTDLKVSCILVEATPSLGPSQHTAHELKTEGRCPHWRPWSAIYGAPVLQVLVRCCDHRNTRGTKEVLLRQLLFRFLPPYGSGFVIPGLPAPSRYACCAMRIGGRKFDGDAAPPRRTTTDEHDARWDWKNYVRLSCPPFNRGGCGNRPRV